MRAAPGSAGSSLPTPLSSTPPRPRGCRPCATATYTRVFSASDLAVNDEGLFAIHAVRVDEATEAIGRGLDAAALEVLARTAPEGRTPEVSPDGSVRLRARTLPSTPDLPVSADDLEAASPWDGGARWGDRENMMRKTGWKAPQIEHQRRVWRASAAMVRFIGLHDVGAGARYTISSDGYDTVGGYFRLGGHFHLDMQGRFGGAFGTDLGLGRSFQFRPFLGLRARLTEQLFLGMFPFNPLYTGSGLGVRGRSPGWTFRRRSRSASPF